LTPRAFELSSLASLRAFGTQRPPPGVETVPYCRGSPDIWQPGLWAPALPARVPGGQRAPPTHGRSDPDPPKVLQVVVAEPALEPSLCDSRAPECSRGTVAPPHYGGVRYYHF
ncbi:unnamed protein product, partial [Gulo gulo]